MLLFALTPWILLNICVASAASSLDNVETLILNASLGGFDSERLRSASDSSRAARRQDLYREGQRAPALSCLRLAQQARSIV